VVKPDRIFTSWPNEEKFAYCRVLRTGNIVWMSGTTATEGAFVKHPNDMYGQCSFTLAKIKALLGQAGASIADVVQTRCYITDMERVDDLARALREYFADVRPTNTTVEVSRLAHPDMLIEIEATAVLTAE
jgi:enamine deaminase RidA (YjgF/YER057c/UK114 family)